MNRYKVHWDTDNFFVFDSYTRLRDNRNYSTYEEACQRAQALEEECTMKKDNIGFKEAKAQLAWIVSMVERMKHLLECDGGAVCKLKDSTIMNGLGLSGNTATDEDREEYHNEEETTAKILDSALSVEVSSGWVEPDVELEPTKYRILLCTGGPAVRIVGEFNHYREPVTAKLEYQDWSTPWTEYPTNRKEDEALLQYAQEFYYGV